MSNVKLYHFPLSAPSRGALLAARVVGVPIEIEIVDLFKKEQLNEDFVKKNPQHCVPTLDDDGFVVWESRAIACYLAEKYGTGDLYPQDLKLRTLVNQRLYFDAANLFPKIRAYSFSGTSADEEKKESLKKDLTGAIGFLEMFLSDSKWVAGDNVTIADTSIYASMTSILAAGWDISACPNIQRWVNDCATLPGYEENQEGAKAFGDFVKNK